MRLPPWISTALSSDPLENTLIALGNFPTTAGAVVAVSTWAAVLSSRVMLPMRRCVYSCISQCRNLEAIDDDFGETMRWNKTINRVHTCQHKHMYYRRISLFVFSNMNDLNTTYDWIKVTMGLETRELTG